MNRRRLPILLFTAAVVAAGCSSAGGAPSPTPAPTQTPVATQSEAPSFAIRTAAAKPQACMDALISGRLARNAGSGLGLITPGAPPVVVEWPFRYSARDEDGRIALLDETGAVVAREGDNVKMGGGMGQLNIWYTCGPVEVVPANG